MSKTDMNCLLVVFLYIFCEKLSWVDIVDTRILYPIVNKQYTYFCGVR